MTMNTHPHDINDHDKTTTPFIYTFLFPRQQRLWPAARTPVISASASYYTKTWRFHGLYEETGRDLNGGDIGTCSATDSYKMLLSGDTRS